MLLLKQVQIFQFQPLFFSQKIYNCFQSVCKTFQLTSSRRGPFHLPTYAHLSTLVGGVEVVRVAFAAAVRENPTSSRAVIVKVLCEASTTRPGVSRKHAN